MLSGTFLDKGTSYIKNPLGIIGLFIALIYSVAVLVVGFSGSLTDEMRWVLVSFAVLFPPLILWVFYHLVAHHHSKLYAPTDWKDERLVFGPQTLRERELREEAQVELLLRPVRSELPEPSPSAPVHGLLPATKPESPSSPPATREPVRAPPAIPANQASKETRTKPLLQPFEQPSAKQIARTGQDIAFEWLAKKFPDETIYRNVTIAGARGPVSFDGLVVRLAGRAMIVVDVKVFRTPHLLSKVISDFEDEARSVVANANTPTSFLLLLVPIEGDRAARQEIEAVAKRLLEHLGPSIDLQVVNLDELQAN